MTATGVLKALYYTVIIWLLSVGISLVAAIAITYLRMCRHVAARAFSMVYIRVARGIPPLAWMFVIFFGPSIGGAPLSPLAAGTAALAIVYTAYISEIYRSSLESVSADLIPAALATGLRMNQAMRLIVIPSALRLMVGEASSIIINMLKESSLASLIGVTELTYYATATVQTEGNGLKIYIIIGAIYFVISTIVGVASRFGTRTRYPII